MARYQVLKKLATGGMAEVFLGRAIGAGGFQKPVAIKRILPNLAADAEFLQRFYDEAHLTVHLQHSNLVQVFDLGRSNAEHLMVLEFVDGETLRSMLTQAAKAGFTLEARDVAFIVQQVAEGLAWAHEAKSPTGTPLNIVHRDINPSNVMVSSAGEVKLADFGIAKAASASSQTLTGTVRGKAGYFAPEVARGLEPDQRSDVFLMGLMLFEAITGQRLFKQLDFVKSLHEVVAFDVAALQRPAHVPEQLWQVVVDSLQPVPSRRLQTAREMSLKLSSFLFDNRLRVGPNDISQLFSKIYPTRKSSLDATAKPITEISLSDESQSGQGKLATNSGQISPTWAMEQASTATQTVQRPAAAPPKEFAPPLQIEPAAQTTPSVNARPSRPGARPKARFGEILVARKLITPAQLDQALAMQKRVGGMLGDVCVSLGLIGEDDLYLVLAEQKGHRFVRTSSLEKFEMPEAVRKLVPKEVAFRLQVLPMTLDDKRQLFVALADPGQLNVLDEVRSIADVSRVTGVMIRPKTLEAMLERAYLGKKAELELPVWVGEQSKMIERFGAKAGDGTTRSREQVFGEEELSDDDISASGEGQVITELESFLFGASAANDLVAARTARVLKLVRKLAHKLQVLPRQIPELERQTMALCVAAHLEHRRAFDAPNYDSVTQLLGTASASGRLTPPDDQTYAVYTRGAPQQKKPGTASEQALIASFGLLTQLGDGEGTIAQRSEAALQLQRLGDLPAAVMAALSEELAVETPSVAVVASPGSRLFSVAPALQRLGFRVSTHVAADFGPRRPSHVVIEATLQSPPAIELVRLSSSIQARVAALAPSAVLPVIAHWKAAGDVTALADDDLKGLIAWARHKPDGAA